MFFLFLFFFPVVLAAHQDAPKKVDPCSRIEIKSNQAVCKKTRGQQGDIIVIYQGKVRVTFADGSWLTTETLTLELDALPGVTKKKMNSDKAGVAVLASKKQKTVPLKTMRCEGLVVAQFQNKSMTAQTALCNLETGKCVLSGDVTMTQVAEKKSEFPVCAKSNKVLIDIITGKVILAGSAEQQVCTVVELGNTR